MLIRVFHFDPQLRPTDAGVGVTLSPWVLGHDCCLSFLCAELVQGEGTMTQSYTERKKWAVSVGQASSTYIQFSRRAIVPGPNEQTGRKEPWSELAGGGREGDFKV